jgi:hypothetical protein
MVIALMVSVHAFARDVIRQAAPNHYLGVMEPADTNAYYWAGIGIVAVKFDVKFKSLSLGDLDGHDGCAILEPVGNYCDLDVGMDPFKASKVEDYATTLLAGSAASYIRARDKRCHLKRSLGEAGLEIKFLRQIWQSLHREPDRAIAIIFGSLGAFDDGDTEGTTRRLWHRAVCILQQQPYSDQLRRLARELTSLGELTGAEVHELLKPR